MLIVDAHTDALWKMANDPDLDFYAEGNDLQVNYPNMVKGGIDIQVFAIFVSDYKYAKFANAINAIDIFYEKVVKQSQLIQLARNYQEIEKAINKKKKVSILSLEGAEALEGDLGKLRTFYRLGVRALGLTWNNANEAADGVQELRGGGLTNFGRELVSEMNHLKMMFDVSHLSEHGFWDLLDIAKLPIMASHSNTKKICNHPRNLTDDQIKAIINKNGIIGATFVKNFTANKEDPTLDDLIKHIDHIASLGGINNIGLGSDFDGANPLLELENASKIDNLVNTLVKKYKNDFVEGIMGQNWLNYYQRVL